MKVRKRRLPARITVLLLAAVLLMSLGAPSSFAGPLGPNLADDFSLNTGYWTYSGQAVRESGDVYLTTGDANKVGQIWLQQGLTGPFTAEFQFRIVPVSNKGPADGIVLMYNKTTGYTPADGGCLGFTGKAADPGTSEPGYGVEFDTFLNSWDQFNSPASVPHTAVIRDTVTRHYSKAKLPNIADSAWHKVKIVVTKTSANPNNRGYEVRVYLDNASSAYGTTPYIDNYAYTQPRSYASLKGFGFTASTGDSASQQCIRDFILNYNFNPYNSSGAQCTSFDSAVNNTVVMKAQGLVPGAYYQVAYYDGKDSTNWVYTDAHIAADASGNLQSSYTFSGQKKPPTAGTWYAALYANGSRVPTTYSDNNPFMAESTFTVQQGAIPEFPAAAGPIVMFAVCGGIFLWQKKRRTPAAI